MFVILFVSTGSQAFPVHVHGRPAEAQHVITMFYIIPVGFDSKTIQKHLIINNFLVLLSLKLYCTIMFVYMIFVDEPTGFPSMETKFHNLAYVLQNEEAQYDMAYGQQ